MRKPRFTFRRFLTTYGWTTPPATRTGQPPAEPPTPKAQLKLKVTGAVPAASRPRKSHDPTHAYATRNGKAGIYKA